MKKLVSIIVPVFNVEKYLRQCLDSILGQTFNQFEVIIVNDGSTDNSGVICQEYEARDNRIVYLEKENGGVSEARNLGLDFATSEYIIFIDSDDWIEPTYVEVLYEKIEEYQADIRYSFLFAGLPRTGDAIHPPAVSVRTAVSMLGESGSNRSAPCSIGFLPVGISALG